LPCGGEPDCVAAITSSSGSSSSLLRGGDLSKESKQWTRTFDNIGIYKITFQ